MAKKTKKKAVKKLTAQGKKAQATRAANDKAIEKWVTNLADYSVDELDELQKFLKKVIAKRLGESANEELVAAAAVLHKAKLDSQIDFRKLRAAYAALDLDKPDWAG